MHPSGHVAPRLDHARDQALYRGLGRGSWGAGLRVSCGGATQHLIGGGMPVDAKRESNSAAWAPTTSCMKPHLDGGGSLEEDAFKFAQRGILFLCDGEVHLLGDLPNIWDG
jgi:hypothetical protein